MLRYYLFKSGVMATGSYDVGGFAKTRPDLDRPDIQLMFAPYSLDFSAQTYQFEDLPGMQFFGYILRPESQGHRADSFARCAGAPLDQTQLHDI